MWRIRRKRSEMRRRALQNVDVLVIDGTDATADLTLLGIRSAAPSAQVVRFRDATKALRFVLLAESRPDLILLDLGNPVDSGLRVLEQLRNTPRTSTIPVVVLTTTRDASAVAATEALGANGFIAKPSTREEYCVQMKNIVRRWLTENGKPAN
jgi:two-component system, chemotaxis family, response regulator Rcp1